MLAQSCGGGGAESDRRERARAQWKGVTMAGRRVRVSSCRTAEMRPRAADSERDWTTMACKVEVRASA